MKPFNISFLKRRSDLKLSLLFLLPSLCGISIFFLIPFADVIRRSFRNAMDFETVGLANYQSILENDAFRLAAFNTLRFLLASLPLLLFVSLGLALLIHHLGRKATFLKASIMVPFAIPAASIAFLWQILFDSHGLTNALLSFLGLEPISWMDGKTAFWLVVGSFVWKNMGYSMILWLAGLSSISPSLYEAAYVDGAGSIQALVHITLPSLKPTFNLLLILSLINAFKSFRETYLVAGDYPHNSIYQLQHLFQNWFRDLSMEKLAAAAVLVALCALLIVIPITRGWFSQKKAG